MPEKPAAKSRNAVAQWMAVFLWLKSGHGSRGQAAQFAPRAKKLACARGRGQKQRLRLPPRGGRPNEHPRESLFAVSRAWTGRFGEEADACKAAVLPPRACSRLPF